MVRKKTLKKSGSPAFIDVLVQAVNDMSSKLHRVHKDVANNSKDINDLRQQIAFGRGALRVLLWVVGILTTVFAVFQWLDRVG